MLGLHLDPSQHLSDCRTIFEWYCYVQCMGCLGLLPYWVLELLSQQCSGMVWHEGTYASEELVKSLSLLHFRCSDI